MLNKNFSQKFVLSFIEIPCQTTHTIYGGFKRKKERNGGWLVDNGY